MFKPRPSQAQILEYVGGRMGISAVPGSGKTHTLSYLAAQLISNGLIQDEQEILIVTLVNSAVDNFSSRISNFVKESGLLENVGYRVRTLHGLAHDIVKERPEMAGLSNQFSIVDETESFRMIDQISTAYYREQPELSSLLLKTDIDLRTDARTSKAWLEMLTTLNANFISQAKDFQLEPETIRSRCDDMHFSDPLLEMGIEVYVQYQRGLHFRNAVDFSDLIRLAYRVLETDQDYLKRLQHRWPFILEDEAQDSSLLQEKILRALVGNRGNWVRVGDPNQAIYETFTTASPKHLKDFLKEPGVLNRSLPNSGRSNLSIINLANSLVNWSIASHPVLELRNSLTLPLIQPTPIGDPQENPPDQPNAVYILKAKSTSDEEIQKVVQSIKNWLPEHQDKTIAVLCPIAWHGEKVVEALQAAGIEVVEQLKSSQSTRKTASVLEKTLQSLADPSSPNKLARAFSEIYASLLSEPNQANEQKLLLQSLKKCKNLEDFFYPINIEDWRIAIQIEELSSETMSAIELIRSKFVQWHNAVVLPIDQLILTIAQDIFTSPAELALSHKLALMLEFSAAIHPEYQLNEFALELADIAGNTRKFAGFSDEDTGFDPQNYKGKVFVSTFHKAKGLEWDRVYLLSVNNYDFPSAQSFDSYKSEKWFIRDGLNPEAELLNKLNALAKRDVTSLFLKEGIPTREARIEYSSERLRLLYVGITRARESLIITWNSGRRGECAMALPLEALHAIWEERNAAS